MISLLAVWAAEIARSAAISIPLNVSMNAAKKLHKSLTGMPKTAQEMETYDRDTIVEAVSELSSLDQELSFAINLVFSSNDKELLNKFQNSRQRLERLRDSIEFSQHFEIKKNADARGLVYIDSLLLTKCYVVSEATKDAFGGGIESNKEEKNAFLSKLDCEFRKIDRVAHIRSLAVEVPLNQLLRILEAENPDLYEDIKSVATFALSIDAEKTSIFKKGGVPKKIAPLVLHVAQKLEVEKGPYVGLKEFFLEFRKSNPDKEILHDDVEKALNLLKNQGLIQGLEPQADGVKIVIFRLDDKKVWEIVTGDVKFANSGVTAEELACRADWSVDYSKKVLNCMEEKESARRVLGEDAVTRWYFPGIFSQNNKNNQRNKEIQADS